MHPPVAESPTSPRELLNQSVLALPLRARGKVRDIYDLPPAGNQPRILIVATDRVSAFDVVLPTPIPGKGRVLTGLSAWWFRFIESRGLARTHLLSTDVGDVPDRAWAIPQATPREVLAGRVTVARRCRVIPIECVVRGYLEGSGWREYQQTGAVCGVRLPPGLTRCDRLPEPIFTPATKAPQGQHDENISFEQACETVGESLMRTLRERSLAIYRAAADHARSRGIIITDTKFEWGLPEDPAGNIADHDPMLIDEALTPDSSRFWPADRYRPGQGQESFDKQPLRDYLEGLKRAGQWDGESPPPPLPAEVAAQTAARYAQALALLTGSPSRA